MSMVGAGIWPCGEGYGERGASKSEVLAYIVYAPESIKPHRLGECTKMWKGASFMCHEVGPTPRALYIQS